MTRFRHGKSFTRVYGIWSGIKARCLNPNVKQYPDYGGRGITICERWMTFDNFLSDMGDPPDGMSIERLNNDDGYHPGNCKWASRVEQGRNKRGNRIIEVNGVSKTLAEWADISGLSVGALWLRLAKGWGAEQAVTTPKITNRKGVPRGALIREYAARHGIPLSDEINRAA